jgi:hypothetical protein
VLSIAGLVCRTYKGYINPIVKKLSCHMFVSERNTMGKILVGAKGRTHSIACLIERTALHESSLGSTCFLLEGWI